MNPPISSSGQHPALAEPQATESGFILIVDDNPTNLSVLSSILKTAGLRFGVAIDGEGALASIEYHPPDLILLDIQMPGINGFEVCRQLKENPATASIPVIFMTALNDAESKARGFVLGAVDYIPKPFDETEVLARLRLHLRLKQLTDTLEDQVQARTLALQHLLRDRKAADAALQQKEAQYRSIFEAINDGIFITEIETGKAVVINPATAEMHGYSREEFLQLNPTDYVHSDSLLKFAEFVATVSAGNRFFCEAVDVHRDGSLIDVEVTGVPFLYGDKLHALALVRDISEQKRKAVALEQTLQTLQRTQMQMVQSEKMSSLGQLVAGIAHEINNPVSFIHGNINPITTYIQDLLDLIDLYQQTYSQPNAAIAQKTEDIDLPFLRKDLPKLLASMQTGSDRIRDIVSSLRNFSRLDESGVKAVDIHKGIDSTLMIVQHRLKVDLVRPEIQVIKRYGSLPRVECFAGQLNQVFMNLLTNAIDAVEARDAVRSHEAIQQAPSTITITTELAPENTVVIRIADNGPGIPEAVMQKIFDPFFTTKPVGQGTGMGLSISYQIITERHHGKLYCESGVGVGTTFVIEIPLQQPTQR